MTTSQLWPPVIDPRTLTRQVWDSRTARGLPGMGRALGLYSGLIAQMALRELRGSDVLPTPRILERPDPDMARATFVSVHVEDYLLHGNACHLVTARDAEGWPAATRWYPAHAWGILEHPDTGQPVYHLHGREVRRENVVHVQRGADPVFPYRGIGVVEQHLPTLDRVGLETAAGAASLRERGMPAVAIIKPNPEPDPVGDDLVADKWVERFSGPAPKPGIFPHGTTVTPLSWNPSDQQMVEARSMSLKDVANLMNLDGYWLGAEGSSHTYRSPGPMYLTLLRTSLAPVLDVFEDVWSFMWRPRGRVVRFDRTTLLRDDLQTMVTTFSLGLRSGLFADANEPREYMGFPPLPEDKLQPPAPEPAPVPDPEPEPPAEDVDQEDDES